MRRVFQGDRKGSPWYSTLLVSFVNRVYYTRAWQADSLVYSRGDPLRSPWWGNTA
ncbi:MAG: hypothetical protein ABI465_16880 [Ktedonobacteraceae bacterium]